MEEPGGLQSMGLQRVRHDWMTPLSFLSFFTSMVVNPCTTFSIKLLQDRVKLLSRVRLFVTPWTVAYQAPPSMGFFRQEYWSGLPFPSPGDLPNAGIEPRSPTLQTGAFTVWATREVYKISLQDKRKPRWHWTRWQIFRNNAKGRIYERKKW